MIDPIAINLFGLDIYWYGLLWIAGFYLARYGAMKLGTNLLDQGRKNRELIDGLLFYALVGALLGGRLGYVLIYGLDQLKHDPWWIFKIQQGGMSFHGGLLGVVLAVLWFAHAKKLSLLRLADVLSLAAPLGLACGRVGNFINGELWGRITDVPWAVVFPNAGPHPRHPSQLYEMLMEGLLLFWFLAMISKRKPQPGIVFSLFLLGYGTSRFLVEFFREPDAHMGYYWLDLTAGQLLSLPMIVIGLGVLCWLLWQVSAAARRQPG